MMMPQASEIIMLDGLTILYKSSVDLFFYVMGSSYENELLLMSALDVLFDSLNIHHLRHLGPAGLLFLTNLFNLSIANANIPSIW